MDIKIGFTHSNRELSFPIKDDDQDAVIAKVTEALEKDSGILQLEDAKGHVFLVSRSDIAYVEVGSTGARPVGFA